MKIPYSQTYEGKLKQKLAIIEMRAWKSLRRYKFMMFGYWAAMWVHLNQMRPHGSRREPNPFRPVVDCARWVEVHGPSIKRSIQR